MNIKSCPKCEQNIPDYRLDDPYCDCGWQLKDTSVDFDEIGYFTIFISIIFVCFVELIILCSTHFISTYSLSLLENLAINYISVDIIVAFHFIATLSFDILLLALLFCGVTFYLGKRLSHPILMASIMGVIVVGFKFFVLDPASHIGFTPLSIIVDLILLILTIGSGMLADHFRKKA